MKKFAAVAFSLMLSGAIPGRSFAGMAHVTVRPAKVETGRPADDAAGKCGSGASEQWVALYNGPGNADDAANAVAVDGAGNVYVAGTSRGAGTGFDATTIKYDPDGNELWIARYDGPANAADEARAIALDAEGKIYVAATSTGDGTGSDYATVSYDPDGKERWAARYDGPASGLDAVRALAVDAAGNIYVTGTSAGDGTGSDYATIKYDLDGNELWAARYDGPANNLDRAQAIAVDADGNVYVTGTSRGAGSGLDYATLAYDPDGNELWAARYDGPLRNTDEARAIAVHAGPPQRVYVTGTSVGIGTLNDFATIGYDADGNELWAARYNGPGNGPDSAFALAADGAGNLYVAGWSVDAMAGHDAVALSYDSEGNARWVARYNGPGNGQDEARALALDPDGNLYLAGFSWGGGTTGFDFATLAYDFEGNLLWAAHYAGPGNSPDRAAAVAVDAAGPPWRVYVTGSSTNFATDLDFATVKYAPK